jgi:hypothetical protein
MDGPWITTRFQRLRLAAAVCEFHSRRVTISIALFVVGFSSGVPAPETEGYNNSYSTPATFTGPCLSRAGLTDVKAIAASQEYTTALKKDGTTIAWG